MPPKLGKQVDDVLLQMWKEEEEGQYQFCQCCSKGQVEYCCKKCHEHGLECDEFKAQEWEGHKLI